MLESKCPSCNNVVLIEEENYKAAIEKAIEEFIEREKEYQDTLSERDLEIIVLKAQLEGMEMENKHNVESTIREFEEKKNDEIEKYKKEIKRNTERVLLRIKEAEKQKDNEITILRRDNELNTKNAHKAKLEAQEAKKQIDGFKKEKDDVIARLKNELDGFEKEKEEEIAKIKKEIDVVGQKESVETQRILQEKEEKFEAYKKQKALELEKLNKEIKELIAAKKAVEEKQKNVSEVEEKAQKVILEMQELLSVEEQKSEEFKKHNAEETKKFQEEISRLKNLLKSVQVEAGKKEDKIWSEVELHKEKLISELALKEQKILLEAEQKKEVLKSEKTHITEKFQEEINQLKKEKEELLGKLDTMQEEFRNKEQNILSETTIKERKALEEAKLQEEKILSEAKEKHEDLKKQSIIKIKELNEKVSQLESDKQDMEIQLSNSKAEFKMKEQKLLADAEVKKQKLLAEFEVKKQKFLAEVERKCVDLKNRYTNEIEKLNEKIAEEEEFRRQKLSRMVGESLGKYTETELEKVRSYAFPNVRYEKEGFERIGGRENYILRERNKEGVEIFSIMFEMKDGLEGSRGKDKNEDFLRKLDKERNSKNCEYAVLVSMLEMDNEFYNIGIVDVSHKHPKMYVIRPNFFITLIGILRNTSLETANLKQELSIVQNQTLEAANIQRELTELKDRFERNRLVNEKYQTTINEVNQAIRSLQIETD
jgi:hypothetical protein